VYVSGQLSGRTAPPPATLKAGTPDSSRQRLVRRHATAVRFDEFADKRNSRAVVKKPLSAVSNEEALKLLTTESEFWSRKAHVAAEP
jgi:hypothetical protein